MTITHIGLLAGAITTAAAFPQVVRTYRTKHARDISIWQPILLNEALPPGKGQLGQRRQDLAAPGIIQPDG